MAESTRVTRLSELRLSIEDREQVARLTGELIAVNVYREIQRANELAGAAAAGGNIIGNCCSSSQRELLQ
jgi:hypothetical protein